MKRCMGCMELYKDDIYICPFCGYEENTLPEESFHLMPGTVIGQRYQVGRVLGFGGFGVTYIGYDSLLEKKIAIKEYLPSEFATRMPAQTMVSVYSDEKTEQFELGMNKFVEEAKKLAKFNETVEIVNVYDCIQENNTAYIIMEYLEGKSLKKYLEEKGKLTVEEAENIILPILRSLQSVHAEGLIHRDIAPDNIFLTNDGRVKLLDFGAARYASATHSRSLSVIYKPGYAPEEQYQSRGNQGTWTDIYALAATLYKMITGITPDTSIERRAKDRLVAPSKLGVTISKNKETALLNALNIQVKNRTKSAEQFLNEWESQGTVTRAIEIIKNADVGKLGKKSKIAILVSIAIVGVISILFLSMGGFNKIVAGISVQQGKERMPSVINATVEEAQAKIEGLGFLFQITGREYSDKIDKDLILEQSEQSGSIVNLGHTLGVVVSGGIRQIYMPSLLGKTEEEAMKLLENSGFKVTWQNIYSDTIAPGKVVKASLEAGTQCNEGSEVLVYISEGIDPSKIVDFDKVYVVEEFVGLQFSEVEEKTKDKNIYVDIESVYDDSIPEGEVISQYPVKGTEIKSNDEIKVVVSAGKRKVLMPDLMNLTFDEAKEEIIRSLKSWDLSEDDIGYDENTKSEKWVTLITVEEYNDTVASGLIVKQSLKKDKTIKKGKVITLTISKGKNVEDTDEITPTSKPTAKPTPTPKPTAKPTPTPKPTAKPTPTPKPAATPTPAPHRHNYSRVVDYLEATCGQDGYLWKQCDCGEYSYELIPATGYHEYSIFVRTETEATCAYEGSKIMRCVCGAESREPIPATGYHDYSIFVRTETEATCVYEGSKIMRCSACGAERSEPIPATGYHDYSIFVRTETEATCVYEGSKIMRCSACGAERSEPIPATGYHIYDNEFDCQCNACGYQAKSRTEYLYYHYTDGKGNYCVCKYNGTVHLGYSGLYYEESGWLSTKLKCVSKSPGSFKHVYYSDKCTEYGCENNWSLSWSGGDRYQDENGVFWYYEQQRTVRAE